MSDPEPGPGQLMIETTAIGAAAAEAQRRLESREVRGVIVLDPTAESKVPA